MEIFEASHEHEDEDKKHADEIAKMHANKEAADAEKLRRQAEEKARAKRKAEAKAEKEESEKRLREAEERAREE